MFQRVVPSLLDDLADECKRDISGFHSDVTSGVRQPKLNPVGLVMLQRQLCAAIRFVDAAPADLRREISSQQREANRRFVPVIQQAMQHAYDICVAEAGKFEFYSRSAPRHYPCGLSGLPTRMLRLQCTS